jgi:GTP-binding protein
MSENPHVTKVEFIKSAVKAPDYPDEGDRPEIAIAGRSNVGKSSLINKICNRRHLAKVSRTPGRTQLLNFFRINDAFVLCDLPGYGYAKVPEEVRRAWGPMVERYLTQRRNLKGLLLLMDVRRDPGDWETDLIAWCTHHGRAIVPVVTKVDKLPTTRRAGAIQRIANDLGLPSKSVVGWSAETGEGLEELWARIARLTSTA